MKFPNFEQEKNLWRQGILNVAGLDEAGRGPLAGPVVAAAVVIAPGKANFLKKINDSKKLSEKKRNYFFDLVTGHEDIKWGIGVVSEKIIDEINILEASKLAMLGAVADLECRTDFLLLDGCFRIGLEVPQQPVIRGDQKVISISAASVVAKVTRDRIMCDYHNEYPEYGFKMHKGYPTALHLAMLGRFGACPIHRKSFFPVSRMAERYPQV